MNIGIKETTEMVRFTVAFAQAIEAAIEKGPTFLVKLTKFVPTAMSAPDAFAGANLILDELKDLSAEKRDKLITELRYLDLKDDEVEAIMEVILSEALVIQGSMQRIISQIKAARKPQEEILE